MANICEQLLPPLENLVGRANEPGTRVVCITALPSSGKSTQLVPALWRRIKAREPLTNGLYIQQHAAESKLLQEHLEASDPGMAMIGTEQQPLGDMLVLGDFGYLRSLIFNDGLGHRPTTIFLDLELVPTEAGDITISRLVEFINRVIRKAQDSSCIEPEKSFTLVLLGSHLRPSVELVMTNFLHIEMEKHTFMVDTPMSSPEPVRQHGSCEQIRSMVYEAFAAERTGPGPCVLLFMHHDEAKTAVVYHPDLASQLFAVYWISTLTRVPDLGSVVSDPAPKLICIDPSTPFVVPLPVVHVAISTGTKKTQKFDPLTSHYPLQRQDLSRVEMLRQEAWLPTSSGTGDHPVKLSLFCTTASAEPVEFLPAAFGGDPRRMILDSADLDPAGVTDFDQTAPALYEVDLPRLLDARRRLVNASILGVIDHVPQRFIPTPFGRLILSSIRTAPSQDPEWDLACGLAQAQLLSMATLSDRGPSEQWQRVMIRLAAISRFGIHSLFSFTEKAEKACCEGRKAAVLSTIAAECAGVSTLEQGRGSIWTALGLWQKRRLRGHCREDVADGLIYLADGNIAFDLRIAKLIFDFVVAVEVREHLEPLPEEREVIDTLLSPGDRIQALQALVWAYWNQMVLFGFPVANNLPRDAASMQIVDVDNAKMTALDLEAQIERLAGVTNGFCALYEESEREGHKLVILDLTLVPAPMLADLENTIGISISECVNTTYPVPTRPRRSEANLA